MEKKNTLFIIMFILLLLCVLFILLKSLDTPSENEIEILDSIQFMKKNNLTIYGATTCGYCKKQLEEFGEYNQTLKDDGMFIYCDLNPTNPGCLNVTYVPAWKQNNEIVYIGLLKLNQINETFIQL